MLRLKRAASLAAILFAAACTADSMSPTAPTAPRETISDAAHTGLVPGFYFLPSMVPQPSYSGTFDAALQPRVEICEVSAGICTTTIATFTFGTGSSSVRLGSDHYIVNWKTSDFNLDPAKTYRISVYQGAFRLGYADVDVVGAAKDLKNVDTNQFIPLLDDRTLPIKFRIETGIPAQVTVTPASDSVDVGDTKQFTASCTDLHGNAVACPATTWTSSDPSVATVDGTGLATGVDAGTVTITASIGYAQGTATLKVIQPNTPPVGNDDSFEAIGNVTIPVAAPGVLANDTDTETPSGLSVVPGTVATANGGTATLAADGSFTYLSPAGYVGGDSFGYTVTDGSLTATATVTMTSTYRVWYVDNTSAGPGDGRDASPFSTLAAAEGPSTAGETVFLLYGNGTPAGYGAGFGFKAGQSLTGQGVPADVTAVVNGQSIVLLDAGSAPTVTSASGATLRLATNNTAQGMNVLSTAGAGVDGSGFGTFTAGSIQVAAAGGPSLDLQNGTVAASFGTLSSSNSTGDGLRLSGVGGSLTAPAGVVVGAADAGVDVSGGNAVVNYGGSIAGSGVNAARVTGRTGGTLTLSGDITDTNGGILVQGNSGGTISFNGASKSLSTGSSVAVTLLGNAGATVNFGGGGLNIATAGATGFSATGGGTVNVTGADNVIATASGTGLRVALGTTIGSSGLSFRSISATSDGSGIVLSGTGAANGLQVTGSGVAGSGGTIQGMSGDAVSLTSATNVRLAWMTIQNNLGSGIFGSSVTDVRVENSSVLNNADNAAAHEAGIRFDNLFGTSAIDNTTVSGSIEDNVRVENTAGTLALLSVSGSTIRDNTAAAPGRHGLLLSATGAAAMTVMVQNSHFIHNRIAGVEANTSGAGVLDVSVTGGSLRDNGLGVEVVHNSTGALTYNVLNIGTITGQGLIPINVNRLNTAGAASTFAGTISGNVIGAVGVPNSGAAAGPGIRVQSGGVGGTTTTAITNNTIREVTGRGVDLLVRDGSGTLNATVTGNTIALTSAVSLEGIRFDSGALSTDTTKACAAISGNTITTFGGFNAIRLRQRFLNTTFNLAGYGGSPTNDAAVVAFLISTNTVANAAADHGGAGFLNVASCPTP
jgi:hypothetical protein